jgi:hypothetical protein
MEPPSKNTDRRARERIEFCNTYRLRCGGQADKNAHYFKPAQPLAEMPRRRQNVGKQDGANA